MATGPLHRVIQGIRTLVGDPQTVSDGLLLKSFIGQRDEAAFTILVERHGPMVMGVCRRLVDNFADAQDAFQATFLTLARKASSVSPAEMVGNWIYGVAYRTALEARGKLARLRSREKQVENMPEPKVEHVEHDPGQRELLGQLDHELSRLPDKYRVPVVLCELEGRSRKDVAQQLQLPEGTLSSRLATARKLLADRLGRRGMTLSAASLTALLAQPTAQAAVTPALIASTVQLATLSAAGNAAAASHVAALSNGVIHAMFMSKLKFLACGLTAFCLLSAGLAYVAHASIWRAGGVSPPVEQTATEPLHDTPGGLRPPLAGQPDKISTPSFTKIHLKTGKAVIRQTGKESFAVKGDDVLAKLGKASVVDGTLVLSSPAPTVEFVVECKELSSLTIEGVTTVDVADLKTKRLEVVTSAVGQVTLSGTADEQIIEVKGGAARFDGSACKGKQATVLVSGAGQTVVNVSDKLKVTIPVSGQVEYLGSPVIEKEVSVAGTLSKRE